MFAPAVIVVSLLTDTVLLLWTSWILPNRRVPVRALLPAAAAGGVVLEALKLLGAYVVPRLVEHSSALYGTIGIVFAWVLGLGVLFLALFSSSSGGNGLLGARALFGSIFGLSGGAAQLAAAVGLVIALAVAAIARPLLFASVDPDVAAARGLAVRAIGLLFLVLLGATAAEATQIVIIGQPHIAISETPGAVEQERTRCPTQPSPDRAIPVDLCDRIG